MEREMVLQKNAVEAFGWGGCRCQRCLRSLDLASLLHPVLNLKALGCEA